MKKENIISKGEYISISPLKIEGDKVIFGNKNFPNIKIPIKISDFQKEIKPHIKIDASDEQIIQIYLDSIFKKSFHETPEIFGHLSLYTHQYSYAKDLSEKLEFIKDGKITEKGINFLFRLKENKSKTLNSIANGMIAFSTFLGIGGATVYYSNQIWNLSNFWLSNVFLMYTFLCILMIWWLGGKIK
ncbi:MAG: hypothetical protein Q7S33_05545 [Nanoarchaeota archaeon]|nr:hypothetical protein [Nanoarchaeota archaeon]